MPRVSVCIPSYNLASVIGETIRSVLAQTFQDWELLIEDDGSTDNSVAVIAEFQDPRIKFVASPQNIGQNATTNNLVKRAAGEYICLLPADDLIDPTKLEKQVAYLDEHPECGICFTRQRFIDMQGNEMQPSNTAVFEPANMKRDMWRKRFLISNCFVIASCMYRRTIHYEVGYFDESLHLLADLDFYIRAVKDHDLHIIMEPLATMRIRDGANLSFPSVQNLEKQADEMQLIRAKYRPTVKQKKFFIATPFYELKGFSPYIESLLMSLAGLSRYAKETGIEYEFHHVSGDSYVWRARNTLAAKFMASDCSHLIFIDSDEAWEVDGLYRLIAADADMVGAAYPVKNNWQHFGVTIKTEGPNHYPKVREDGLIYADKVPTGFMKISRKVFEAIKAAEPDNWYWEPGAGGDSEKRQNYFGHIQENHVIYGEDISFVKRWQATGGEVFVEPRITIEHYGIKGWKGNYDEFLKRQPGGSESEKPVPPEQRKAA